jgi:Leucine-rich repeat (LRR) protein
MRLKSLNYTHSKPLTGNCSHLKTLTALRMLDLTATDIEDEDLLELKEITSLKVLKLARNKLSDNGINYILKLKKLSKLDISRNFVTKQGIRQCLNDLPALKILKATANNFQGESFVDDQEDLVKCASQLDIELNIH